MKVLIEPGQLRSYNAADVAEVHSASKSQSVGKYFWRNTVHPFLIKYNLNRFTISRALRVESSRVSRWANLDASPSEFYAFLTLLFMLEIEEAVICPMADRKLVKIMREVTADTFYDRIFPDSGKEPIAPFKHDIMIVGIDKTGARKAMLSRKDFSDLTDREIRQFVEGEI